MTQRVFHSPRSGSVAAATTPERLARELDGMGVLFAVQHNKGLLLAVLIGCLAAVILAGSLNDRHLALERHVKRLEATDGQTWIEIRTRVEEDDGG